MDYKKLLTRPKGAFFGDVLDIVLSHPKRDEEKKRKEAEEQAIKTEFEVMCARIKDAADSGLRKVELMIIHSEVVDALKYEGFVIDKAGPNSLIHLFGK